LNLDGVMSDILAACLSSLCKLALHPTGALAVFIILFPIAGLFSQALPLTPESFQAIFHLGPAKISAGGHDFRAVPEVRLDEAVAGAGVFGGRKPKVFAGNAAIGEQRCSHSLHD